MMNLTNTQASEIKVGNSISYNGRDWSDTYKVIEQRGDYTIIENSQGWIEKISSRTFIHDNENNTLSSAYKWFKS